MPEVGDFSRHLQGVDTRLQRSSQQGWASRCFCDDGSRSRSETYNNCSSCNELIQDVKLEQKPFQLQDLPWKALAEIPPAPAPMPVTPATEVALSSPLTRVTRARSSTSAERDHHARASPRSVATSPYLQARGQRGRPPNGSRVGPEGFKGVRQRKGVRGFLVEIRPPKWKKTIWLGTYSSDREAAGAYDAGTFYTNKKTRYNFPALKGTFKPLPDTLRLDNADHSEEIKTFVQHEAREAALKVKNFPIAASIPNSSPNPPVTPPAASVPTLTSLTRTDSTGAHPCNTAVSSSTSSSEESASASVSAYEEVGLPNPADDEEWFNLQQMMAGPAFVDFTAGYSAWSSMDFEPVNLGFIHPLP